MENHKHLQIHKTSIAFKNTNTLQQLTKLKINHNTQDHERSGVYKLTVTHANCHTLDRQTLAYREL